MKSIRHIQNCDKSNERKQFYCLHQFMSDQMKCSFPWLSKNSMKTSKECSSSEDLDQYYQLYTDILQQNMNDKLEEFGCLLKNCKQNSWISDTLVTIDDATLKNNPYFEIYFIANKTTFWFSILTDEVKYVVAQGICLAMLGQYCIRANKGHRHY